MLLIHSSYDPMNGIMTIAAGIDMNNYDKTKELIGKQIKDLQIGISLMKNYQW